MMVQGNTTNETNDNKKKKTNGDMVDDGLSMSSYLDEEDVLGFKIWVAELELLVGGSTGKGNRASSGACYRLLQKLNATVDRTHVDELKEYQRRCEDALVDILLKGAAPPVCGVRVGEIW